MFKLAVKRKLNEMSESKMFFGKRKVKIKEDIIPLSPYDQSCSLQEETWASMYCNGFSETIDLLNNVLGLEKNTINPRCVYNTEVDKFRQVKKTFIKTAINMKAGGIDNVIFNDEFEVPQFPMQKIGDKCIETAANKISVFCLGSKKASDVIIDFLNLDKLAYSINCIQSSELMEGIKSDIAVVGIRRQFKE